MSERVAVVDLGTNAVRFVLARIRPGVEFRVLREERVQTRLAAGRPGTLPRIAVRDTLTAMREFLSDVHERETPRVLAVASAAVRRFLHPRKRQPLAGQLHHEDHDVDVVPSLQTKCHELVMRLTASTGGSLRRERSEPSCEDDHSGRGR